MIRPVLLAARNAVPACGRRPNRFPVSGAPVALILWPVVLKHAGLVCDVRKPVLAPFRGRDNDLLGLRVDNQIGVVGDENDLAPPFRCLEVRRQQLVVRLVVEVFVGLIDNQRAGIAATSMSRYRISKTMPFVPGDRFSSGAKEPLYTTTRRRIGTWFWQQR